MEKKIEVKIENKEREKNDVCINSAVGKNEIMPLQALGRRVRVTKTKKESNFSKREKNNE